MLHIGVLGPLTLTVAQRRVDVSGTTKRAALALLALHAGVPIALSRLASRVWGEDPPAHARSLLRATLAELRTVLSGAPGELVVSDSCCRLDVTSEAVDLLRARRLAERGREALRGRGPDDAADLLDGALRVWRGPALCDVVLPDGSWPELAELREEHLALREDRFEVALELGDGGPVIDALRGLIREEPLRERPYALLMRALAASGRTRDALEVYDEVGTVLAEEWGIDPGGQLRDLRDRLAPGPAPAARPTIPGEVMTASAVMFGFRGLPDRPHDPEPLARLLDALGDQIARAVGRCGDALVIPLQGATALAVFDAPQHTACAVRCALAVLDDAGRCAPEQSGVSLHAAIASGTVRERVDGQGDGLVLTGGPLDACRRLLALAPAGGLLVDEATLRAAGDGLRHRAAAGTVEHHEVLGDTEAAGCAGQASTSRQVALSW